MKVNYTNYYSIIIAVWSLAFLWYYVTIPGSKLSPDKKHPKPSLKTALMSYFMYAFPIQL